MTIAYATLLQRCRVTLLPDAHPRSIQYMGAAEIGEEQHLIASVLVVIGCGANRQPVGGLCGQAYRRAADGLDRAHKCLDALASPYDVTPGVPAFAAAAAAMARELTLPEISQTVVLTRTAVRSSPMPPGQDLKTIGATGATLAIHLSVNNLAQVVRDLTPLYGADCPVVVAYRVSWPDQAFVTGTLGDIRDKVKTAGFTRTALVMVGRVLGDSAFTDSRLYAADHSHILRPAHQQHGQG